MKPNFLSKILSLMLMLLLVAFASCALAEEEMAQDSVELYAAGGMAEPLRSTYALGPIEDYLVRHIKSGTDSIDLRAYNMPYAEFKPVLQDVLNRHPELFNFKSDYSYTRIIRDGVEYIARLLPQYKYTGTELTRMNAVYENGVNAILNYTSEAETVVGKLLRANDYLCANYAYDVRVYSSNAAEKEKTIYSPELFFEQGTGVCQAYMLAYRAVLNELNVPNTTVSSSAMNHTWNLVYLDDSDAWYHVDVTWNDALSNKKDMPLRALHKYFMLSDSGITKASHHSWVTSEKATSTKYDNYFWTFLKHPAPMIGDVVYYADDTVASKNPTFYPVMCTFDLKTGKRTELFTYQLGSGTAYPGNHPVWATDTRLYYVIRNKLYAAKLDGTASTMVYQTSASKQWIFQLYQDGMDLKMHVTADPNVPGSVHTYELVDVTFAESCMDVTVGDEFAILQPYENVVWSSSNTDVATVDQTGAVQTVSVGVTTITAEKIDGTGYKLDVIVHSQNPMALPKYVNRIDASAFAGINAEEIVLPEGTSIIASGAFANCTALRLINLPVNLSSIAQDAFEGADNAALICHSEMSEVYAKSTGLDYVVKP